MMAIQEMGELSFEKLYAIFKYKIMNTHELLKTNNLNCKKLKVKEIKS